MVVLLPEEASALRAVVVPCPPLEAREWGAWSSVTAGAAEGRQEGSAELSTGARVDDRIHGGVTVAQPKEQLEHQRWDGTVWAQRV